MKREFLSIVLALLLAASYGQGKIDPSTGSTILGKLIDSATNLPLESATVTLYATGKTTVLNRTISDTNGLFRLTKIPPGNYTVVIEFVGYRPINIKNITVTQKNQLFDLKRINATKKSAALQSVIVTAPPKLVDNKIDKLVFNAERDITSQTGVATDLLMKVPMVSVDVDGNVELEGSTNVLFLINGKPSTVFGSNITDVLQSIPANQIKSIEVITNPGAKYDAQGTGGIINIILKHNTVEGINGNVSLTAGTLLQNGSFNINARKGKFGLNAFMNGNARLTTTTPTGLKRVSMDTVTKTNDVLQQNGASDFSRHGFQSGIGFDWTPSENNSLSGALNYANFGNKSKGSLSQLEQTQNEAGGVYADTNSTNNTTSAFRQYSFDPSLDYKHSFKNKDQQLEISMDGSFAHNSTTTGNDQFLQPQDSLIYGTRNNNPAIESEYEAKLDYTQPLRKDVSLGAGGKFSGYDISSTGDALVWTPYFANYLYDSTLSNNLNYHQKVYAAYAELNFPISRSIDARLGGRYERTQINSFYSNAHQVINKGYNTFIPSIFLMKKIDETQTFKLNFTIRINRPGYSDLNPFINTSDPKNISTGNPNLKPEVWDRFEAGYNKDLGKTGSFMINLFYRQSNGDIQPFIVYYPSIQVGDTAYSNVAVTTQENIGIEENAGTNLFFDLHVNEKFNVRSNIIVFYRHTINQVDPGYNSSTTIYRFNVNTAYQFSENFAAEFFGNFSSRHNEAQGKYPSYISYNLALRKLFWNKKGSIALTANNLFSKYVDQQTDLYGPGFSSSALRRVPYRSVGLNFTWKFGRLIMKKEKSEENTIDLNAPPQ
jgi:ferric enterobactin receptor